MFARSRHHLAEAGESYFEHLRFASTVGLMAIGAGLACLIHALVPALCQKTCSATVGLLQELFGDRRELDRVARDASGPMTFVGLLALSTVAAVLAVLSASIVAGSMIAVLAFALPVAFLLSNPDLGPVVEN